MRNGARYIVALSVGLRRGEALGLNWNDLAVKWRHGWVTTGVRDDGKVDRRHVKRSDEGDAIEAVRELERMRDSGKVRKPGRAWTVERWLTYWVENIAASSVRHTTMVGYRSSVYNHLIPGIGKHRIDKLQPEHLEALYRRMQEKDYRPGGKPLRPGTVHLAHRTVRVALNEAVRRRHIVENPARVAKPPRVEEEEIVPFSQDEAWRLIKAAADIRNGARYIVALSLGLRRGEALALKWSDIAVSWKHGCIRKSDCRQKLAAKECPVRQGTGTLTVRRALQQRTWQHGCEPRRLAGIGWARTVRRGTVAVWSYRRPSREPAAGRSACLIRSSKPWRRTALGKRGTASERRTCGRRATGSSPTWSVGRCTRPKTTGPGRHFCVPQAFVMLDFMTHATPPQRSC